MMKTILTLMVIAFLPCSGVAQSEGEQNILVVEILGTYGWKNPVSKGIYIHWPNGEEEKIIFKRCDSYDECIMDRGRVVQEKFQELYNLGWIVESVAGGDTYSRYIFRKK